MTEVTSGSCSKLVQGVRSLTVREGYLEEAHHFAERTHPCGSQGKRIINSSSIEFNVENGKQIGFVPASAQAFGFRTSFERLFLL